MFKESIIKFLKLENLMENLTGYVETRIEILKYDLKEDFSKVASKVSVYLLLALVFLFFLLFLSLAMAFKIAETLGMFWGCMIVGVIYILAGGILFSQRVKLIARIEEEIKVLIKHKRK